MGATVQERRLTAFGTKKTVAEWAADPRARVWAEAILARLDEGMTPEQAIGTPLAAAEGRAATVLAFGERKTVRDWADDYRCRTSYDNLRNRLAADWSPEAAVETPTKPQTRCLLTAWGETKSLTAWADDPRAGAERHTIQRRLEDGMSPEEAVGTPTGINLDGLTAFGETRTMRAWAADPRCSVTSAQLARRVETGMAPEEAITKPNRFADRLAQREEEVWPEGLGKLPSFARLVTAFGETKSVNAWAHDPRCAVGHLALSARLDGGMPPEEAITTVPTRGVELRIAAFGETKNLREWAADPRCEVDAATIGGRLRAGRAPEAAVADPLPPNYAAEFHEAFGETKTLTEWAADPRCAVTYSGLVSRVRGEGMTVEAALRARAGVPRRGRFTETAEAFGEARALGEWLDDARCVVSRRLLNVRLRTGWALEEAMTTPERTKVHCVTKGTFVVAFGERKNLTRWAEDPRCAVTRWNLAQRLEAGWDVERALTTPSGASEKASGEHHWRKALRTYAAFGETKGLADWAADPRCAVGLNCLRQRLRAGMPVEEALTQPGKARYEHEAFRAFGEVRTLREWAVDPRCRVSYATLQQRLSTYGMAIEPALTTPLKGEGGSLRRAA